MTADVAGGGRTLFEQVIGPVLAAGGRDRPAVTAQNRSRTYGQLDDDVRRCIGRLADEGLEPGALVLVDVPDVYMFWALAFACEALGLAAGAAPPSGLDAGLLSALRPARVVTSLASRAVEGWPTLVIDAAFVADLQSRPPAAPPARARRGDDPVLVLLTSGTTGSTRAVEVTRAMLHARNAQFAEATPRADRPQARVLALVGPWSLGGVLPAFNAWRLGGRLCSAEGPAAWTDAVKTLEPDHLFLAPVHLQTLLAQFGDWRPSAPPHVFVIGGTPSAALVARARAEFTPELWVCYGSTETGVVAGAPVDELGGRADVAGRIWPWVQAEVLDPAGAPAAPGSPGELRVRLDGMAHHYRGEAADAPGSGFRDGWFHPGDLASIDPDGVLRVHGRLDDLLHMGGAKLLPSVLERVVEAREGVRECAAFTAPDPDGLETPYVAVAATDAFDPAGAAQALAEVLGRPARLVRVDVLPRNALGKVDRVKLRTAVVARPG